ncbi:MAG: Fic family protein [Armatimonadetes bacterium]|nr:Fic family protein [Armatimonadota bacterium]
MSRYEFSGEDDSAFEPGSDGSVLKNRLAIIDPKEIGQVEAHALFVAIAWSDEAFDFETEFSFEIIKDMHRQWLGHIYPFAGELRTVNVTKDGFMFAPVAYLENSIREIDSLVRENTPCEGLHRPELVAAIALVHSELLLVHPFREGNGRIARWLADLMAIQGGLPPLDWAFEENSEARREEYFAALRRAYIKQPGELEALVDQALTRALTS